MPALAVRTEVESNDAVLEEDAIIGADGTLQVLTQVTAEDAQALRSPS